MLLTSLLPSCAVVQAMHLRGVYAFHSCRSNPQVDTFLAEANKAANIAAQARYASEQKSLQQQGYTPQQPAAPTPAVAQSAAVRSAGGNTGAGSVASSGEDQTWHCGSCLTTNYLWRDFCSKCKKTTPNSYGTDKQSKTWKVGNICISLSVQLHLVSSF